MIPVTWQVRVPSSAVWNVLADGWLYGEWVVGASRIRDVDRNWPQAGSRIHHSSGLWPVLINDTTQVEVCEPERRLVLTARGWPAGEAKVDIRLTPVDFAVNPDEARRRGSGASAGTGTPAGPGTEITILEDATSGPATLVPEPVRQALMVQRNKEALRRLGYLAEGRARS